MCITRNSNQGDWVIGFSFRVTVLLSRVVFYGCSSPTSKRDLIQLIMFNMSLNMPIKNKEYEARRMRKFKKNWEISITSSLGWVLVTVVEGWVPRILLSVLRQKRYRRLGGRRGSLFGPQATPFVFQVPLRICPDPLHLQPLPLPLRLGVCLLLGGILTRAAGGVQVELLRPVHLLCRLRGFQVRDPDFTFHPRRLACVRILMSLSFLLIAKWCLF